jgi:hypothetical protein
MRIDQCLFHLMSICYIFSFADIAIRLCNVS